MSLMDNLKQWICPGDEKCDDDEDMTSAWNLPEDGGEHPQNRAPSREVNIRTTTQLKVLIAQPKTLEDLPSVADELKKMMTVVLNLETLERNLARRMLDVLSGVAYALDARIFKIASATYMILPYDVEFKGDLMDELASRGILRGSADL